MKESVLSFKEKNKKTLVYLRTLYNL